MDGQNDGLQFRLGTEPDLPALKSLRLRSYGQLYPQLDETGCSSLRAALEDEQNLRDLLAVSTCFVCAAGDRIVGMVHLVSSGHPWDVFPAEWCYIRMLGVDPGWQGRGIARELTRRCMAQAIKSGESTIALHTSEMMDAARHIYESLGFRREREISRRFGKRYWLYVYTCAAP